MPADSRHLAGALAARMAALPLETRDAISDRGFEACGVLAGIGDYPAEACVQFARASCVGNFCNIARVEAAAGQNRDAIPSLLNQS